MEHIFENACMELEYKADPHAFNKKLTQPQFIGQGCSKQVGSDCYGYYIVEKKDLGKKTIWGIQSAKSHFASSWTDGTEICDGPLTWKASEWIVQSGWWKNRKTGEKTRPKFYFCDENGKKFNGAKCYFSFSGAYSYRDPSF